MDATITIRPPPSHPFPTVPPGSPPSRPHPPIPPIPYFAHIDKSGQDALWAGFVVFVLSTLVFAVMASRLHAKHRVFHLLTITITGVAALSYYAMATHSGVSYVRVGWQTIHGTQTPIFRQIFWARYVDWLITIPLWFLNLTILAGLPWINVVSVVVLAEVGTLTALFSGLRHDHKASTWIWFAFGCVLAVYIIYELLWTGRKTAKHQHADVSSLYTKLAIYTVVILLVYPVLFALSQGIGILNPNKEAIAFTVLDIFMQTVFGIWLLVAHKHDSEDAAVCLPDSWTEHRGARRGRIHLPGGDE